MFKAMFKRSLCHALWRIWQTQQRELLALLRVLAPPGFFWGLPFPGPAPRTAASAYGTWCWVTCPVDEGAGRQQGPRRTREQEEGTECGLVREHLLSTWKTKHKQGWWQRWPRGAHHPEGGDVGSHVRSRSSERIAESFIQDFRGNFMQGISGPFTMWTEIIRCLWSLVQGPHIYQETREKGAFTGYPEVGKALLRIS